MFGLIKRSTHEAEIAYLKEVVCSLEAQCRSKDATIRGLEAVERLQVSNIEALKHDIAVISRTLTSKVDRISDYKAALREIRGMTTPGANATVKRMAARAEYALQTYACVPAEAA